MGHPLAIESLADRPDLTESLGDLRWFEMGPEPGLERRADWVAATVRESGSRLPVTFAAVTRTAMWWVASACGTELTFAAAPT